jgi:hypothetical protein
MNRYGFVFYIMTLVVCGAILYAKYQQVETLKKTLDVTKQNYTEVSQMYFDSCPCE